jgi:hypothetical protein
MFVPAAKFRIFSRSAEGQRAWHGAGRQLIPSTPNPRVRLWLRQEDESTRHANSPPDRLSLSGNQLTLFLDGAIQSGNAENKGSADTSSYYIVSRYSMPAADIRRQWVASSKGPCRSEFFAEG